MAKYGMFGVGADYSRRTVSWIEVGRFEQVGSGSHGAGMLTLKAYIETRRN